MCVDYDPPDVWREDTRRARKQHRCDECGRTIEPGENYEVTAGLGDGYWYGAKTCGQCVAAREWLLVVCSGCLVGDVLSELREHTWEPWPIATDALERLVGLMEQRWAPDGVLIHREDVAAIRTLALIPWRAWNRRQREERAA